VDGRGQRADPSDVEAPEARKFLEAHLGREVEAVELAGEGAWSRCFGFRDPAGGDDADLVVRFGRYRDDFENDRRAAEFAAPGLPVPRVLDIGEAFGAWFAISTRVRGEPLEAGSAELWKQRLPAVFTALDAMRTADLSGTAGFGGWDASGDATHDSWREFLLSVDEESPNDRTHGWKRRLRESPGGDAVFRAGYAKLAEVADAGSGVRSLVHSDLINRNVYAAGDRITGVFDWGCSLYGDFLYDLAWLEFWSPWFDAMQGLELPARARAHFAERGVEVPDYAARLRACLLHIGLSHLAYHAFTGDRVELSRVEERTRPLLDAE
jgi:hygromycin-B 4-O-kinase